MADDKKTPAPEPAPMDSVVVCAGRSVHMASEHVNRPVVCGPGTPLQLPPDEAKRLIATGHVRLASDPEPAPVQQIVATLPAGAAS
jgi:hypothetical protein